MTAITDEQRIFLDQHTIPLSRVFDATGMKRVEYQKNMRALDLVIAVGTSRCDKAGHRMRTRGGHCAQCNPAVIAFMLRNDNRAHVYIAASPSGGIIKVGSSQNPDQRMQTLNAFAYGGYRDWQLRFSEQCDRAGFVEFNAHRMMKPYSIPGSYKRGIVQVACLELFACELSEAIAIVKNALTNHIQDSGSSARVDVDEQVAHVPLQTPPTRSARKEPTLKKVAPCAAAEPAYAQHSQPMLQTTSPSFHARVTPDTDMLSLAPPKKKSLADYFVFFVAKIPVAIIFLLVLVTIFKSLRGLGR
jgi:hypothetical protein